MSLYTNIPPISVLYTKFELKREGGLIIRSELIYEYTFISVLYTVYNFELKRSVGLRDSTVALP